MALEILPDFFFDPATADQERFVVDHDGDVVSAHVIAAAETAQGRLAAEDTFRFIAFEGAVDLKNGGAQVVDKR